MLQKHRTTAISINFINRRILVLSIFVFGVASAIGGRFFFLQILRNDVYVDLARRQQQYTVSPEPTRGTIYMRDDKTGKFVRVATTQNGYILYLDNRTFSHDRADEVFTALDAITPIDRGRYNTIIQKKDDPYEILKSRLTYDEGERVLALTIPGVGLVPHAWRLYPGDTLASHVIGFVSHAAENPT